MSTQKKVMKQEFNIGRAKYVISYHDGISTHRDGSPFYGIRIFHNVRKFRTAIREMKQEGYIDQTGVIHSTVLKTN